MTAWSTRVARPADLAELSSLLSDTCDAGAMPSSELLADAIARGLVRVAEADSDVVGCIAAEMPAPGHIRLSVISVWDGMRRQGMASRLLAEMVEEVPQNPNERPLISAVATVDELAVVRLLLKGGFPRVHSPLPEAGCQTGRLKRVRFSRLGGRLWGHGYRC
ncbi:N-acetyltransferase family protein [Streptomyces sp. NRAIS4]